VVFLVEKDVRVERRCTCDYQNHKEINGQYEVCTRSCQKNRNEEVGRSVPFVTEIRPRDKMSVGIMGVMEVVVVAEKLTAYWMVGDLIMYQRLPK
jgi:hypothetical protein